MTASEWDPSLEPVRRALLDAARKDAARALDDAVRDADGTRRRAAAAEQQVEDEARASGASDGELEVAGSRRRLRSEAQATVLAAQRDAYLELLARVRGRLAAMRDDESYPQLRQRLVERANATLGPDATIIDAPEGGIVASLQGRTLVLTLPVLADGVATSMGSAIEGLWTP